MFLVLYESIGCFSSAWSISSSTGTAGRGRTEWGKAQRAQENGKFPECLLRPLPAACPFFGTRHPLVAFHMAHVPQTDHDAGCGQAQGCAQPIEENPVKQVVCVQGAQVMLLFMVF